MQENVLKMLKDLNEVCPIFYLAGGALRDYINKREIKDYDIYFDATGLSRGHRHSLSMVVDKYTSTTPKRTTGYDSNVLQFTLLAGGEVQMIECFDPIDVVVKDFDIDLCKIYFNHNVGIKTHLGFADDFANKTLTVNVSNINPMVSKPSDDHIQRVIKKYPDYAVRFKLNNRVYTED